jgi:hypothetical protein
MRVQHLRCLLVGATAIALSACGGGGVESTPFVPAPPPAPPPPGSSVLPPEHLGLVSSDPFAILGVDDQYTVNTADSSRTIVSGPSARDMQFSYDAATNTYQIAIPDYVPGKLANTSYNGTAGEVATSTISQVTDGASSTLQPVHVFLPVPKAGGPYTYTSLGYWYGDAGTDPNGDATFSEGIFAYGIPTAASSIPITGSASYAATVFAMDSALGTSFPVEGDAKLSFDFGAGTLSGSMHPQIIDDFDGFFVDYGVYTFKDTVYSTGSTTFSGKFEVPNLPGADSFFNGQFTGPNAVELMTRFLAPYRLSDGHEGTLSGIWIGKKTGP